MRSELPSPIKPEAPVGRGAVIVLAVAALLIGGYLLFARLEEERRELEARQQQLEAELAKMRELQRVLIERLQLLQELETAANADEPYLVLYAARREGHLRQQDRTLRRFALTPPGRGAPPIPGRYRLEEARAAALLYNNMAVVAQTGSEPPACPEPLVYCSVVAPDDFAALARTLKPVSRLLVFP
ncbi:MAG: hypothetical protein HYY26_06565 [Acidobacteria bacterium]|nr:hypothetical protein [Acidobacteriota bacterium]